MQLSQIKTGSLLEIYIKRNGNTYKVLSKIAYVDKTMIGVPPIASKTHLFKFLDTDRVDIICKQDSDVWKWENVKAGYTVLDNGTQLHTFEPPEDKKADAANRRTTFRYPINTEIELKYEKAVFDELVQEDNDSADSVDEVIDNISDNYRELTAMAYLKDVSEGWAAISSDVLLEKGDMVSFEFVLADEKISCKAVIVRVKPGEKDEYYENYFGVSFIKTSPNFVKCLFREQRKSMSRSKFGFD